MIGTRVVIAAKVTYEDNTARGVGLFHPIPYHFVSSEKNWKQTSKNIEIYEWICAIVYNPQLQIGNFLVVTACLSVSVCCKNNFLNT